MMSSENESPVYEGLPACERCDRCDEVYYAPDPYASCLLDNDSPCWMCDNCRSDSAMEI